MNTAKLLQGMTADKDIACCEVSGLTLDSRAVQQGFAFVALQGETTHGLQYAKAAIANGASVILFASTDRNKYQLPASVPCISINNLPAKLGILADRFHQSPSSKMALIGVTGTNGKTSCCHFIAQCMPHSATVGTLGYSIGDNLQKTANTTPDALSLQEILAGFVASGKRTVVVEASSHGLQQGRLNSVRWTGVVFTNLSRDHLDYHRSMENYLQAKLRLFQSDGLGFAVVNCDQKASGEFIKQLDEPSKCWTYSAQGRPADVTASQITCTRDGTAFTLRHNEDTIYVVTKIIGDFNVDNILAVATVLLASGYTLQQVADKIAALQPIRGRMEKFGREGQPQVLVDYAHTPDALDKLLASVKKYCNGLVRLVFGCGGDRDRGKRQQMGKIASLGADVITLTNDNPRFEDPRAIIADISRGISTACTTTLDRSTAIIDSIKAAAPADCVVVAGKGHETTQDIQGVRHLFSDQQVVQLGLTMRGQR